MAESIFDVKENLPEDNEVASVLGDTKKLWDELRCYIPDNFKIQREEWKFYNKKAGWVLVFNQKQSNLLYMIPRDGYFSARIVLGEKAVNAAVNSSLPKGIIDNIISAIPYVEGRSVDVEIRNSENIEHIKTLLQIKRGK